jgi:hypothetical protein
MSVLFLRHRLNVKKVDLFNINHYIIEQKGKSQKHSPMYDINKEFLRKLFVLEIRKMFRLKDKQ